VPRGPVAASERDAVARSIVSHALEQLAYYKAPGYVAFVEVLPLTPSQKIQRGELKGLAASLHGHGDCIDTTAMKKRQP
jgi:acyl-coenzyme A synthetase/AMP-(fatty) acid ligase